MELHRLAIVLMALMLAFSIAFAAGQVASSEQRGSKLQSPPSAPRSSDQPVLRLGGGTRAHKSSAPPIGTPRPPLTALPPLVEVPKSRESSDPKIVTGDGVPAHPPTRP
jgi:hypothetical protein